MVDIDFSVHGDKTSVIIFAVALVVAVLLAKR